MGSDIGEIWKSASEEKDISINDKDEVLLDEQSKNEVIVN